MADIATTSVEQQSSPKSTIKKDRKKPTKTSHPSTAIMVNNAIQNLKERGGSSLQAIKKYISATYKIDAEKFSPFIKKYLKTSVASGGLVQTKGKGASGSFKLASTAVTKKTVSKPKKVSGTRSKSTKTKASTAAPADKKTTTVKASAAKSTKAKKALEKRKSVSAKITKPKSPLKAKKSIKSPTKKPKSPKPKTTKPKALKKKASPKKK